MPNSFTGRSSKNYAMFSILPLFTGREKVFTKSRSWLSFISLLVLFTFPVALIIFFIFPEQIATIEARYNIWRNHYEIKTYGYIFGDRDYIEMLKQHGISHVVIFGDGGSEPLRIYVTHYNSFMSDAIWRDLGVRLET